MKPKDSNSNSGRRNMFHVIEQEATVDKHIDMVNINSINLTLNNQ